MDELRELVSIVTRQKLKASSLHAIKALQPGPLSMRLYDLVAEGKVKNDEEAMAALYPGETRSVSYQRIKKSLREYLLRMLLVIDLDLPHYNARQKAYFDCYKQWAVTKVLVGKNAHHSNLSLAGELLHGTSVRFYRPCPRHGAQPAPLLWLYRGRPEKISSAANKSGSWKRCSGTKTSPRICIPI